MVPPVITHLHVRTTSDPTTTGRPRAVAGPPATSRPRTPRPGAAGPRTTPTRTVRTSPTGDQPAPAHVDVHQHPPVQSRAFHRPSTHAVPALLAADPRDGAPWTEDVALAHGELDVASATCWVPRAGSREPGPVAAAPRSGARSGVGRSYAAATLISPAPLEGGAGGSIGEAVGLSSAFTWSGVRLGRGRGAGRPRPRPRRPLATFRCP